MILQDYIILSGTVFFVAFLYTAYIAIDYLNKNKNNIDLSLSGDTICHQCHNSNPAWYAPNDLFNLINGSPNGVLCPLCFQKKADEKGVNIIFTVEVITKTD